ncbi:MAG: hypothetical protein ACTSQE_03545 [Candidatus Heimdallarchaeaceae archaeon]
MDGQRKLMTGNDESSTNNLDKTFKCTGCNTPLSIYDERCPNCERLNPHYIYK